MFGLAAALLVAVGVLSVLVGARPLDPGEVLAALTGRADPVVTEVVMEQRMPRTVVGLLVGAGLAVAGVLMQTLTRNPLADPRLFGVSAGASLGVVVGISVLGLTSLSQYAWLGIAGALVVGTVSYFVATAASRHADTPVTFALVGAALDASLTAVIYAILTTDVQSFDQYRFWAVGSLAGRDPSVAQGMAPFLLFGLAVAFLLARGLDALALGDDTARGLGHRLGATRAAAALAVALMTGAAVAAAGPIAFVGLVVPHLARRLVGPSHRPLIALAVLLGPVLVLGADIVGRKIVPGEAPAGVLCALIGAPLLIALVRRAKALSV